MVPVLFILAFTLLSELLKLSVDHRFVVFDECKFIYSRIQNINEKNQTIFKKVIHLLLCIG